MDRKFTLNAWGPSKHGDFTVIRFDFDWMGGHHSAWIDWIEGYFSVTVGLLGFCATLTYWPAGINLSPGGTD